jgi:hypothetical protein
MDLAVFALFQDDLEPGLVPVEAEAGNLRRPGRSSIDLDARLPALEVFVEHEAAHLGHVDLGRGLPRVEEAVGELAVVRQE